MEFIATSERSNSVRSGAYVGGIGAGGFEPRADGRFYRCHIFNEWRAENQLEAMFVHLGNDGMRVLRHDDVVLTYGVLEGVKKIAYRAEFPEIRVGFPEAGVTVTYSSFFIPGDVKNSSLPSVLVRVKGKGKLLFLLPGKYRSIPRISGKAVFLDSEEGSIGLHTTRGKPFFYHRNSKLWMIAGLRQDKFHGGSRKPPRKAGSYECGILWEGSFDDEFVLSWHFPVSKDNTGKLMGHNYANHFSSCRNVLDYILSRRTELKNKTAKFTRSIYSSALPAALKDSYSAQLSTFVKQSWLTRDGKFGVWEGSCVCCGLQTTDVAYYGSWLYVHLFPGLEKTGIRLTADFQRKKDGWIPHFFPGTFDKIDEYRRKDMNMQYVLMVYRNYLLMNDPNFLREMYPSFKKAIQCVYGWDKDGDKMPEVEGTAQTFDAWGFTGCSSYLAILWLAALRAGIGAGILNGDMEFSNACARDFATVRENIIRKLWNGKYFILAVDGKKKDNCCLIDALSGDWFCRLMGLGGILPDHMVVSHLKSCLKLNRKKMDPSYMKAYMTPGEKGFCYINGGYPDNRRVCFQQYEPWTGLEYTLALHLAIMGMKKEALTVVREVLERKVACGMVWNHIECGGDYFRPMVIGALWELLDKKGKLRLAH